VTSLPRRGRFRLPSLEQRRVYQLSRKNTDSFPNPRRVLVQGIYTQDSSELDTDFSNHRDARRFSAGVGLVVLSRALYAFRKSGRMGKEPSHSSPWSFYSHASGLTLVTHETACVPPTCISLACSPLARNLG
jgi:hypothetical protein